MANRIQFRGDTLERWSKVNPILLDREIALVATDSSKPNVYDSKKVGDGEHHFNDLPTLGFECLQELGDSTQFPVSQKVVSNSVDYFKEVILTKGEEISGFDVIIGKYWDGTSSIVNSAFSYADRISVSEGDFILVHGQSGDYSLVYYYSNSGVLLYSSELSSGKDCCVYIYTNGYLMVNSKIIENITIYKLHKNSVLWQLSKSLNAEIDGFYIKNANEFEDGYYAGLGNAEVGDEVGNGLLFYPNSDAQQFKSYKFLAIAGSKIVIYGKGSSSGNSRLYCVIDRLSNKIIYLSEAGEDTREIPKEIKITTDCDVYITNINNDGRVEYKVSSFDLSVNSSNCNDIIDRIDEFNYYALILGNPILNTKDKTFIIPKGCTILGAGYTTSVSEDIIFSQDDDFGSHTLILNFKTHERRCVRTTNRVKLSFYEKPICLIRWTECVYDANFSSYYLDGNLIDFKIKNNYGIKFNEITTKTGEELASKSYYNLGIYKVGDVVEGSLNLISSTINYYNYHFIVKKGSKVIIKGKGGANARLYLFISVKTRRVIAIAESLLDAQVPLEFIMDEETEVYGTSTIRDCYVKIYPNLFNTEKLTSFVDYASLELSPSTYPVLNTNNNTFTLKSGSHFSGNGLDIKLTNDIIIEKLDNFSSHYIIINGALETRTHPVNNRLNLADNEIVICMLCWQTGVVQSNFFKYYINDNLIDFKQLSGVTSSSNVVAPKMYNPILNLQKERLKVLDIGNSYTEDAVHYLPDIITASGVDVSDMCLYKAIRGGASFKNWYDIYNDIDTANYTIQKVVGGLTADISGTADVGNGEKFRNTLKNNEWDLIIIHQMSGYAPYFDRWEENSNAGYLSKFIRLLRKNQPKAVIGFLLVHSYWSGYSGNVEKSSTQRWKLIAESAMKLRANYGIDFIIPYGTAIQNLRASSLNNEYDLTADGTHCANGLADYTAACTYFQSLFAPRYGINILGNTARITVDQTETYPSSNISVTDENAPIAQKAAFLATYNWYECQNPENFDDL